MTIVALALGFLLFAASPVSDPPVDKIAAEHAALAARTLQGWYDRDTGLYKTTSWWNAANAITTLADYSRVTGSQEYVDVFPTTLATAQKATPGFLNKFYDDEGWWALAWIDVYDLTKDPRYLTAARSIFTDMAGGWDATCGGGIWWSKDRNYKNAIANELFLSVAAHLAARSTNARDRASYRDWTKREWEWFLHSGMINADHQVNDGLTAACKNNEKTTWTYNQGVIVGALAEMVRDQHHRSLLKPANLIATATLSSPVLTGNGILREPCEPTCGADGTQFKGIFVRNLLALEQADQHASYRDFIERNAASIWAGAQANTTLGIGWSAPYGAVDASTQSSALDTLVAAASLEGAAASK